MHIVTPFLFLLSIACSPDPTSDPRSASAHLYRASVLLRSDTPTPEEVLAVQEAPDALRGIVRSWPVDEVFGALVRDIHAESLYVRFDTEPKPPAEGILGEFTEAQIAESLDEAPLRLIEHVVMSGRPYTEILTADYTLADPIVSRAYGPAHDPAGPQWQVSAWHDGRPQAGILSSTTLWQRHPSANSNFNRSRATILASALLCDDVTTRAVAGALEPSAQEDDIRNNPDCIACHAILDPLASAIFGMRRYTSPQEIRNAYRAGCEGEHEPYCYPLGFWDPAFIETRSLMSLPAPAVYGQPVDGLEDLGEAIAADPRFPTCTARRFWSYLARVPLDAVSEDLVTELSEHLIASGYNARELIFEILTHPRFAPSSPDAPAAAIRPQQLVRTITALTGYHWTARPNNAWGAIELGTTDRYGFQILMGGIDGWRILGPNPDALPTRELAMAWLVEEAAQHAVQATAGGTAEHELLPEGLTTQEVAAREQLAWLHLKILGEIVDPEDEVVTEGWQLLSSLLATADPQRAWALVLTAFLQDPRLAVL